MIKRIVTRPDFDGIICAVLLKEALGADLPVLWVQPNAVQQGQVAVTASDVMANLPFADHCGLWFDHHVSNQIERPFNGLFRIAPSAARVVYDFFRARIDSRFEGFVVQADKIDSAQLEMDEILHPEKNPFVLVSMAVSAHNKEDFQFCDHLVELFRANGIDRVIADPQVRQRCDRVVEANRDYEKHLKRHTTVKDQVSITDFRGMHPVPEGNRFLVYSLFPNTVVNAKLFNEPGHVAVKLGHSIINRGCRVNLGKLLKKYGGGGHYGAGACRLPEADADELIEDIIEMLIENQPLEED